MADPVPAAVARAVALAGPASENDEYASPESALRWMLALAWGDLTMARHNAHNNVWSLDCDDRVARIVGLSRLVGPLPWGEVDVELILDGIYEQIHERMGTPTPLSELDWVRVREVRGGISSA